MINFARHTLANGLRVVVHEDPLSPLATFHMLYAVGARNEQPSRTGFAHLFEHLMFGGSVNVPDFDYYVQRVGGDSNAYTSNDATNYYITLPADNIETAFWLESDRLLSPAFSQEALDVQKKVVIEEFRQRYLNCPYGDIQHLFRSLTYKVHPYRWPTIGLTTDHIEQASLDEVKAFFFSQYIPRHAILAVSGNVEAGRVFDLAEKWFGGIERDAPEVVPPVEPVQTEARRLDVTADVPAHRVMVAFHMGCRLSEDHRMGDLMTDVLADGASSRLVRHLVKERQSCTDVNAYITGSYDPGLLVLTAQVADGVEPEEVERQLLDEVEAIKADGPTDFELNKARNRQVAGQVIGEISSPAIAQALAAYERLGDANLINTDYHAYDDVTAVDIMTFTSKICTPQNSSTLIYRHK